MKCCILLHSILHSINPKKEKNNLLLLTENVERNLCDDGPADPIVSLALVHPAVMPGHAGHGQGHALVGRLGRGGQPVVSLAPYNVRGRVPGRLALERDLGPASHHNSSIGGFHIQRWRD